MHIQLYIIYSIVHHVKIDVLMGIRQMGQPRYCSTISFEQALQKRWCPFGDRTMQLSRDRTRHIL